MSARAVWLSKIALLSGPLVLLLSCSEGGGGDGGEALTDALVECGLIGGGSLNLLADARQAYGDCLAGCVAGGSCAELEQLMCSLGGVDSQLYAQCEMQCIAAHGHDCGNQSIQPALVCDGFADCEDGSDELDCPPFFMCSDGSEIAASWKCDGYPSCQDGSDELDCPPGTLFDCADGSRIPAEHECDLEAQCSDGSDEHDGCAMLTCPDEGP